MKVAALCGGVGGSKFVEGLAAVLPPDQLTIIGNTGDDFIHLGLTICPDLDTVMYRLAGRVDRERGWGRSGESWRAMAQIAELGGPDWFQLGDMDLAVHLLRSHWLAAGASLTEVTARLCAGFGVAPRLLPMSDRPAPTQIQTPDGLLDFQEWFVRHRWEPPVEAILLPEGVPAAHGVIKALEQADLIAIVPSNPYISIDPILNVSPVRELVRRRRGRTLAVSPLVGDDAVKGPLANMMRGRGLPVAAESILDFYRPFIAAFVQDQRDRKKIAAGDIELLVADTWMDSLEAEARLAEKVLAFAEDRLLA